MPNGQINKNVAHVLILCVTAPNTRHCGILVNKMLCLKDKLMRIIGILSVLLVLCSCSDEKIEEFAFRKTLEISLVDLCGEENKECIMAVKSQISACMEKSQWRKYLENEDNKEELNRFTKEFYACIVDKDGNPYFETKT